MKCKITQYSDQVLCAACGDRWDVNDSFPPVCRRSDNFIKKGQRKSHSFLETFLGTFIGFFISLIAQRNIFPLYGIHISTSQDMQIVLIFTGISIARGYIVRRFFNKLHINYKGCSYEN